LNQFKQKSTEPIIYQLGLEFLRLYDGKFNYPPGHTVLFNYLFFIKIFFSFSLHYLLKIELGF